MQCTFTNFPKQSSTTPIELQGEAASLSDVLAAAGLANFRPTDTSELRLNGEVVTDLTSEVKTGDVVTLTDNIAAG